MGLHLLAEAPLEALLFRHSATATASGTLWAWLAVLAAALGLWRIRSSVALRPRSSHEGPPARAGSPSDPPQQQQQQQQPAPRIPPATSPEARPSSPAVDGCDASSARKSTVFFSLPGFDDEEEGEEDEIGKPEVRGGDQEWNGECGGGGGSVVWWWRGDLGWYRFQDVAALNGRVVRLWEEEKMLALGTAARAAAGAVGERRRSQIWGKCT